MPRQQNNNINKKDNEKTQLQKTKKKPNQNKNMNSMKVKKRHKNPCAKRGLLQCVSVILVINYLVLIAYITQSVPVIFAKLPCFNCLHYTICTCNFC